MPPGDSHPLLWRHSNAGKRERTRVADDQHLDDVLRLVGALPGGRHERNELERERKRHMPPGPTMTHVRMTLA